ncbi:MAG TPA: DUF3761 domain-containing protein [Pseudolysinimonas sp.]|nr:DUF3761 domain-containing protein [Pseudolysinimonas sp.]
MSATAAGKLGPVPALLLVGSLIVAGLTGCGNNHTPHTTRDSPAESPTALCRDGTYSYSQNHRGTCSWHGGVAEWYD